MTTIDTVQRPQAAPDASALMAAIAAGRFRHVRVVPGHPEMPLVNLSVAGSGDPAARRTLALELGEVCRRIGFFSVEAHGLDEALMARARAEIEAFFRLPAEIKQQIHIGKSDRHRGYVPYGEEKALGGSAPDIKEVFDMARELSLDHPAVLANKPFHGPNVWPEGRPGFRQSVSGLFDEMLALTARISRLFAVCFDEPEDFFDATLQEHLCEMRLLCYPPQPGGAPPGQIGCGEHTDYGIVSALWQIDQGGVELRRNDGQWVHAGRIEGSLVCVLGDMTERWTNGEWPATLHRVVNRGDALRHSVAFFCDPGYDCVVEPLPAFVGPARPPRYAPTTMGAHMARGYDGSFQYRAAV